MCVVSGDHIFSLFDKEHILISRRYQLHPALATTSCPNDIKDAHIQQKERKITEKESPSTEIENLKQQHYHHQDNIRRTASP
jgi:hypothetical protein